MSKCKLLTLILGVTLLAACGQKGPLFLPGDMSAGTVVIPEESQTTAEQKEDKEKESDDD